MQKLRDRKCLTALAVLLLLILRQGVVLYGEQLTGESKGSGKDVPCKKHSLTVEEVIKIAEEEIKRTSEEAVKTALLETGSELVFETERARQFELLNAELELSNEEFQIENEELKKKNRKQFFAGICIGGTGGAVITSLIFSLCSCLGK